jgi:ABC-type transport system involved in multi-copper enzyme maturation permease subunit
MIGPICLLELLLSNRRGRLDGFRRFITGWLSLQFAVLFLILFTEARRGLSHAAAMSDAVDAFFQLFLAQHFLLVIFATPAFVAGAITDERAAGTLEHLLTADLTAWEIVVGKLLGRLIQVAILTLAGWPLVVFLIGFGYLDWSAVICPVIVTVVLLFALGAFSMWTSVHSKQTREAVLRVYLTCAIIAAILFVIDWWVPRNLWRFPGSPGSPERIRLVQRVDDISYLDPLASLRAAWTHGNWAEFARRLEFLALVYGGFGVVCLALTVAPFRHLIMRQEERLGQPSKLLGKNRRPVPERDPVRWRERVTGRRLPRWLGVPVVVALTCAASVIIVKSDAPTWFLTLGTVALALSSFVVAVRASGAVSGERERQTWDSLLITPLDTWDLVLDKLHGILESMYPYLLAFAVPAVVASFYSGAAAVVFTVSLLVVTWASMYYMGAVGVHCSARSASSWRSLAATFGSGYGYTLVFLVLLSFVYTWLALVIVPIISFILTLMRVTVSLLTVELGICVATALVTSWFLYRRGLNKVSDARAWVDDHERYGRTFVRSLTRALRKHYERLEEKQRERNVGRASAEPLPAPADRPG